MEDEVKVLDVRSCQSELDTKLARSRVAEWLCELTLSSRASNAFAKNRSAVHKTENLSHGLAHHLFTLKTVQ